MKQNLVNEVHGEGYLYEYDLKVKHSDKNKTDFISGKISLATDEDCQNIVEYHFVYVTPVYSKSGKQNPNFGLLKNIIDSGKNKTVMGAGKENALKLRIDGTIGLNDFWSARDEQIVSVIRNEASFVNQATHLNVDLRKRNTFKTDFVITGTFKKEADEEKSIPEHLVVKGATFNSFSKALLPVSYVVYNPSAIDYFESLEVDASHPAFTKVWGSICSQEFVTKIETKSAFGEDLVEERTTTRKEYVITGAQSDCYEWDSEDTLLASELKQAMSNRELHLAEVKKNFDEYQASKGAANSANATMNVAAGGFNF